MNHKLTYLLLGISFLVSSCNSDTSDEIGLSKGGELSFNVLNHTRALETAQIDQFVVYGDMKGKPLETSNSVVLFNKTQVKYDNGAWNYEGTQYWSPEHEHSFVAVYPESVLGTLNTPQYSNSKLSFIYSVPPSGSNSSSEGEVTDILLATHRRYFDNIGVGSALDDKITFRFEHVMGMINLAPAFSDNLLNDDCYIEFHSLEISEIDSKARFDVTPAPRLSNNQTNDMVLDITAQEKGKRSILFTPSVKINNHTGNINLFPTEKAIIMLPQTFAADSKAAITITFSINGEATKREVSIPLANQNWESGKSYLYKFTIDRTGLVSDKCEINSWNEITGDKITVD